MKIASHLMAWAVRLMPPQRQDWAQAMRAEFDAVQSSERFEFATGCLWVAMQERILTMQTFVVVGKWGVGAVTAVFGAVHLWSLIHLITQMAGGGFAVDAYMAMTYGDPNWFYWMMAYLAGMGIGCLVAAISLIWWRPKLFMAGWALAAASTAVITVYSVTHVEVGVAFWGLQAAPLVLLAGAAAMLAWASNQEPEAA